MNFDKVAIIIAICAVVILIVLGVIWYMLKGKKNLSFNKIDKNQTKTQSKEEVHQAAPIGNSRLDGARVSHRRNHPDRIAQDAAFKESKKQEEERHLRKLEFEKKNKLQIVYSPCNGDILSAAQTISEAKENGLYNPGVILRPTDNKICAPVNGQVKEILEEEHQILLETKKGLKVVIKVEPNDSLEDNWKLSVTMKEEVKVGAPLFFIAKEDLSKQTQPIQISLILDNYKSEQLLLIRNVKFTTAGDKLITIKEDLV